VLGVLIVVTLPAVAAARSGDLDRTFSEDGIAFGDFGRGFADAQAVAVQPDSGVVVAGPDGQGHFGVMRFLLDGTLDPSFGDGGRLRIDFGTNAGAHDLALLPDGRIVVVGGVESEYPGGPADTAVAMISATGELDRLFGDQGLIRFDLAGLDRAVSVGLQSDGAIVIGGSLGRRDRADYFVARLTDEGRLDQTFAADGVKRIDFSGQTDSLEELAVDQRDRIVLAGETIRRVHGPPLVEADFAVARLKSSGKLDRTFAHDGRRRLEFGRHVTTREEEFYDTASTVAAKPNGQLLVTGSSTRANLVGKADIALARLSANGRLVRSFGRDGKVRTDVRDDDYGYDLALQTRGKIVVAGSTRLGPHVDFVVLRYTGHGRLDRAFSGNGRTITPLTAGDDVAQAIDLQPDGRIILAGWAAPVRPNNVAFALARYKNNGLPLGV
jgi:uncharacterized delta-60 repeat protein